MANNKKTEKLVGLFLLIGLILLGVLFVKFGRFNERIKDYYSLILRVDDAGGIIKNSEVRMGGAKIGKVAGTPQLTGDARVEITVSVDERVKIPKGSTFGINSLSILGDKMIVITPPKSKENGYLESGTVIEGAAPSGLDAIQNNAEAISYDARDLINHAEATMTKVDVAIDDIRKASVNLSETLQKVNTSVLSQKNLDQIDLSVANFTATTNEFKRVSLLMEPVIVDTKNSVVAVGKAAAKAEQSFAKIDARVEELKPAIRDLPKATSAIANAANKASVTMDRVTKGDGILGALATDENASTDVKVFMRNLRQRGILRYRDGDLEHGEEDPRNRYRGKRR
jgi:phospholipid/cholesterol/gamma-HCH transport system substrate-binding protein